MGYGYYAAATPRSSSRRWCSGVRSPRRCCRGLLGRRHRSWRRAGARPARLGAAFSILAQMRSGTTAEAYVHRGDSLVRYLSWQHAVRPGAQSGLVGQVDCLPTRRQTDDLAIRATATRCTSTPAIGTSPGFRSRNATACSARPDRPEAPPGRVTLLQVTGTDPRERARSRCNHRTIRCASSPGTATCARGRRGSTCRRRVSVRLGVRNQIALGYFQFVATPGGQVGYLPSVYFDRAVNSACRPCCRTPTPAGVWPRSGSRCGSCRVCR